MPAPASPWPSGRYRRPSSRTPSATSPRPRTAPNSTRPAGPIHSFSQAYFTNSARKTTKARAPVPTRSLGPRVVAKSGPRGGGGAAGTAEDAETGEDGRAEGAEETAG